MPGPLPSRNPRRRNARPEWRPLPASGREGDPPDWPLGKPTRPEASLWRELWASPQAIAWESFGWARMVARYTRVVIKAERRTATTAFLLSEVRQLEDRLGLNPKAMKHLQWEIVEADTATEDERDANVADIEDYRQRLG